MDKDKVSARKAWQAKQLAAQEKLLKSEWKNPPETQREKDIRNLKYIMYTIGYNSILYRLGCYSSLRRAIQLLEEEDNNGGIDN